jgi:20S proteasome alpha/beta subunit
MIQITRHAAKRYQERFAGNVTVEEAARRIAKIFRQARFKRVGPGQARIYTVQGIDFVVVRGHILTLYRPGEMVTPPDFLEA